MAASRFRPPKTHTPALRRQPRPGFGIKSLKGRQLHRGGLIPGFTGAVFEPESAPVLRVSRKGLQNLPKKQRDAIRKARRKALTPAGQGG